MSDSNTGSMGCFLQCRCGCASIGSDNIFMHLRMLSHQRAPKLGQRSLLIGSMIGSCLFEGSGVGCGRNLEGAPLRRRRPDTPRSPRARPLRTAQEPQDVAVAPQ